MSEENTTENAKPSNQGSGLPTPPRPVAAGATMVPTGDSPNAFEVVEDQPDAPVDPALHDYREVGEGVLARVRTDQEKLSDPPQLSEEEQKAFEAANSES